MRSVPAGLGRLDGGKGISQGGDEFFQVLGIERDARF